MNDYLDKTESLTPLAKRVLCHKATEYPHSGEYNEVMVQGTYLCRRCGLALFRASSQFGSGCGWPSFDDEIDGVLQTVPDADGQRNEIVCARCAGHMGHVFVGEYLTHKNLRHCVNSAAIDFVADNEVLDTEEAIVAGGCFWGVEYYLKQIPGVLKVESGYTGGYIQSPTYDQVCSGESGHYEAVRVVYDKSKVDYKKIVQRFFEVHDPTQSNGQGPDIGHQYQSAIFYYNEQQQQLAQDLMQVLNRKGYSVATKLLPAQTFWTAEAYHQDYYSKNSKAPYCHKPSKRFE